jgi:hypothetical protein
VEKEEEEEEEVNEEVEKSAIAVVSKAMPQS